MKTITITLIGAAGAALLFALSSATTTIAQDSEAKWTGPQWEYRVLRIDDRRRPNTTGTRSRGSASEEKLNELGKQGWELVSVRSEGNSEPVFYFKRRRN